MSTPPRHDHPEPEQRRPITLTKLGEMRALGEPIVMMAAIVMVIPSTPTPP